MLYDPNWKQPEPEVKIEPWRKVLLDAADLIENKGWTRFRRERGEAHCAIGAIAVVAGGHPFVDRHEHRAAYEAHYYLTQEINRRRPRLLRINAITTWNDTRPPLLGKFIVLRAMRRAAKRAI